MGVPTPQEAAPAYDDVFNDHPVNQYTPSGSVSAYASVPQDDDVELHAHSHVHDHPSSEALTPATAEPETLAQTIAGVFRPKPHVHCEQCDVQLAARHRRENEKHCCNMVAATFMTGMVCALLLGIVIIGAVQRKKMHGHD